MSQNVSNAYKGSQEDLLVYLSAVLLIASLSIAALIVNVYDLEESGKRILNMSISDALYAIIPLVSLTIFTIYSYVYKRRLLAKSIDVEGTVIKTWRLGKNNCRCLVGYDVGGQHYEAEVASRWYFQELKLHLDPTDNYVVWVDNGRLRSYHISMILASIFLLPILLPQCTTL